MKFPTENQPVKIIMLGAGGTGAHIAPNLYRLLYALSAPAPLETGGVGIKNPRSIRFIIADGDNVEEKNLVRQHFSRAELGMNKARAIPRKAVPAFARCP